MCIRDRSLEEEGALAVVVCALCNAPLIIIIIIIIIINRVMKRTQKNVWFHRCWRIGDT